MSNKDFQNGFALGRAAGGVVEVGIPAKEEQEKTITITENGTTEILPDTNKTLSKVTVVTNVPIGVSENYAEAFNALSTASFMNSNIERIDFYISNPFTSHNNVFRNTRKLKYIKGVNMSKSTALRYTFSGSAIETIEEPLDFSQVSDTLNAFACDNLTEIRFVPETIKVNIDFSMCSKLSALSIQSIIDGLATVTTAQTLTLNSAIILTDAQKATITTKGWTLAQGS